MLIFISCSRETKKEQKQVRKITTDFIITQIWLDHDGKRANYWVVGHNAGFSYTDSLRKFNIGDTLTLIKK